jgi:hypothetical protein
MAPSPLFFDLDQTAGQVVPAKEPWCQPHQPVARHPSPLQSSRFLERRLFQEMSAPVLIFVLPRATRKGVGVPACEGGKSLAGEYRRFNGQSEGAIKFLAQ